MDPGVLGLRGSCASRALSTRSLTTQMLANVNNAAANASADDLSDLGLMPLVSLAELPDEELVRARCPHPALRGERRRTPREVNQTSFRMRVSVLRAPAARKMQGSRPLAAEGTQRTATRDGSP